MRFIWVFAGLTLMIASPGRSEDTSTVPAVWKEQRLNFFYMGRTSRYSCDGLRDKVRAMLLELGARRDLALTALGCENAALARPGSMGPSLSIVFSAPALPEPSARPLHPGDLAAVVARFDAFTITSDAFRNMGVADCELVEEFAHQILPKLVTRWLKQDITCVPLQQSGGRFLLRGEILRSVPSSASRSTSSRRRLGAGHLHGLRVRHVQAQGGQRAPPDATGIEAGDAGVIVKPQRRPMAENHARAAPAGFSSLEPGDQRISLRFLRRPLDAQHQPALRVDIAQARKAIGDEAQAIVAFQSVIPAIRLIAVEPVEQAPRVAGEGALEFAGALPCARQIPLRREARVQHAHVLVLVFVKQRLAGKPLEQVVAVGGRQDFAQRIVAAHAGGSERHGQQVQIVIAQRNRGGIPQRADPAQHPQRIGTAIDEITYEPQPVTIRGVSQGPQQVAEFGVAALHIADCVQRHQALIGRARSL
jgi:hypothetical protein